MHDLLVIDNHSVAVDLLTKGPVIDAGARGFVFSKWFAERGHKVVAYDPSPDMQDPKIEGIEFRPWALVGSAVEYPKLIMDDDPGAWYIDRTVRGRAVGFTKFSTVTSTAWDLIKLNIEGSEYDILDEIHGPVARQIVVSLHEHTPRARGQAECNRLIEKMRQWYDVQNVVWEKRFGCSENYWDLLMIRKDLA